ncbi:helix-turn-helix domain-containing protein [Nonomuraea rosea]|uniref:Helix-turn-helix domain-containing protein n=1 Tax=Nonomuraea rosea TaxID=638574 RepID=A0ABP6XZ69_9ACTN
MAAEKTHRVTDMDTLKALGHPLRIKLYRALFVAGTATASQLADQVGEAVSLVSYHLRKLASHGIIEEARAGRGDARERWWQPTATTISTRDEDWRDEPERAAVHTAVSRIYAGQRTEMYDAYLDAKESWDEDWRDSAFASEYLLALTSDELRQLGAELNEVISKWRSHGRSARETGDTQGRENVAVHAYGFPFRT